MSKSTISTFQLFERFPAAATARQEVAARLQWQQSRIRELESAIQSAPHGIGCWGGTIAAGGTDENPDRHKCTCWKSRALAAPAKEKP
jgi:hypothetical protein